MHKAKRIDVNYIPSSSIRHQGNRRSIDRYLKQGYKIQTNKNGFWVLVLPSQVFVTIYCDDQIEYTYEMKDSILRKYDRSKISNNLIDTFVDDFNNGKISINVDELGYSIC